VEGIQPWDLAGEANCPCIEADIRQWPHGPARRLEPTLNTPRSVPEILRERGVLEVASTWSGVRTARGSARLLLQRELELHRATVVPRPLGGPAERLRQLRSADGAR
jgi:hypothetical protein